MRQSTTPDTPRRWKRRWPSSLPPEQLARDYGQRRRRFVGSLVKRTFRSLSSFNYRTWAVGALVSNVGTWMQRTAQDWLVLTQLTHGNAAAVGIVMALQFGPQALLLPIPTSAGPRHFSVTRSRYRPRPQPAKNSLGDRN